MATKIKRKSVSGIDKKIDSHRKALAKIKKEKSEKAKIAKKERLLKSLQTKLRNSKKKK